MYVLLTGAKKNAGDFLIGHAARRLLARFAPDPEHVELPAWKPIGDQLDRVNGSRALILCGGPAYQFGMGRTVYPIVEELDRIKVPIISFGLGWKGIPGDEHDVQRYGFRDSAKPLFHRLRNDFAYAGCRDYLTWRVLRRHGFENAWMTGCPAWYDPDHFDHGLVVPGTVGKVVVTPAEHPVFKEQSANVIRSVRRLFPHADILCSFHRGIPRRGSTK